MHIFRFPTREILFYFFAWICTIIAVPWKPYLTEKDMENLIDVFKSGIEKEDMPSIHYSLAGLRLLKQNIGTEMQKGLCEKVKMNARNEDIKNVYHITETIKLLDISCPNNSQMERVKNKIDKYLKGETSDPLDAKSLFYATSLASSLQIKVEQEKVDRLLDPFFKSTTSSYIYAFACLQFLKTPLIDKHFHRVESLKAQADELDARMLRLGGGLTFTGLALHSIYNASKRAKKAIPFSQDHLMKFAQYLLSQRDVQQERGAFFLLQALSDMAEDPRRFPPIVTSLESGRDLRKEKNTLLIKVCNVFGASAEINRVTLDSIIHRISGKPAEGLKNISFKRHNEDKTLYQADFDAQSLQTGEHHFAISISFHSTTKAQLIINILGDYAIGEISIDLLDIVTRRQANLSVKYPDKFPKILHLTKNQKMSMNVSLTDFSANGRSAVRAQQVFLIFTHLKTSKEVGFLAKYNEKDASYALTLDVKEFPGPNGKYNVWLIVGDKFMALPIKFNAFDAFVDGVAKTSSKSVADVMKPDLEHSFAAKEGGNRSLWARMLSFVSSIFCTATLFFVLVMWSFFGPNLDYCQSILWPAAGFHLSLGTIFMSYGVFWLGYWNMMELLKFTAVMSMILFMSGNRLLSALNQQRKLLADESESENGEESEQFFEAQNQNEEVIDPVYSLEEFLQEKGLFASGNTFGKESEN